MGHDFTPYAYLTPVKDDDHGSPDEMELDRDYVLTYIEGETKCCKNLLTFDSDETGESYIVYTFDEKNESGRHEAYAAIYRKGKTKVWLGELETDEEFRMVQTALDIAMARAKALFGKFEETDDKGEEDEG